LENIFPHNESEIAQSEAAYGGEFARYWLLNNMVTIDGSKMGKSLGNSLTIQQAISGDHPRLSQGYPPLAIRFFILSSHYRQNTDFSDEALKGATKGYDRLLGTVTLVRQQLAKATGDTIDPELEASLETHKERFLAAMDNDFNTPQALAALFDFNKAVNTLLNSERPVSKGTLEAIDQSYRILGGDILGLVPEESRPAGGQDSVSPGLEEDLIHLLIDLRAAARKNKDFATSDAIRDRLAELGVSLEDRPDGTIWKISRA
jgi:cysteinyl-tRNA synthetase